VTALVTDMGIFEKKGKRFALTGIFPVDGKTTEEVVQKIRSECEWDFAVAENLHVEPPPLRDELIKLRLFDPRNDFLNARKQ
jgi:acyl CoA:acetate/3-ketoacid CoA transferase beta subunit